MPISMYRASVPMFKQTLAALSAVIDKAEDYCADNNLGPAEFLERRLAPDMFNLTGQVQRATFHSAQAAAKLTQIDIPEFDDNQNSFADLQSRIQYTIDFLNTLSPEQFDRSEDLELQIQTRLKLLHFLGQDFLCHFAIPQFLFHVTTAYDIIRNAGVEVGKRDFLGDAANR